MSLVTSIGSFKNAGDVKRQKKDYKEQLKIQTQLEQRREQAYKNYYENLKLGIVPTLPKSYRSSAEALSDITTQKQIALGHLVELLPYGNDAEQALNKFSTHIDAGSEISDLGLFNRQFKDFKSELKGVTNLTPSYFQQLWKRYKLKLAHTQNTGIQIPIDRTEFNHNLRQLGNSIKNMMKDRYRLTAIQNKELNDVVLRAIQERDQSKLDKLFKAVEDGNEAIITSIIHNTRGQKQGDYTEAYLRTLGKQKLKEILVEILGLENTTSALAGYFHKSDINKVSTEQLIIEILAKQLGGHTAGETFSTPVKSSGQASSGGQPALKTPSKSSGKKKGKGIVIKGKGLVGIRSSLEPKFITFGKYLIHVPSLKQGKLNLKYPSKGYIKQARPISSELKNLLMYVLENAKVDLNLFNELSDADKKVFNEVCHRANVLEGLGLKYSDEDKREKIRRFEIVRGEIQAGNDNAELREELKNFIIQFMEDETISYKAGFEILKELEILK